MIIPFKETDLLLISGEKTIDFLNGQCTAAINHNNIAQQVLFSACCTPQGRAIAVFMLFAVSLAEKTSPHTLHSTIALRLPNDVLQLLQTFLEPYTRLSRLSTVAGSQQQWQGFGLCGDNACQSAQAMWGTLPKKAGDYQECSGVYVIRHDEQRLECWGPQDVITPCRTKLQEQLRLMPEDLWRYYEIKAGRAALYSATSKQFLPQMLNLEAINGISYTKGCYTGQEVIARTHHLGVLKRHLLRARGMACLPTAGCAIINHEAKRCGTVLQAAQVVHNDGTNMNDELFELLAVINKDSGDVLFIDKHNDAVVHQDNALTVLQHY